MVTLALPVNEVPGERPTLPPAEPEIVVGPVLVTVLPARTLYKVVVPRRTRGARACAMVVICVETNIPKAVVSSKAFVEFFTLMFAGSRLHVERCPTLSNRDFHTPSETRLLVLLLSM